MRLVMSIVVAIAAALGCSSEGEDKKTEPSPSAGKQPAAAPASPNAGNDRAAIDKARAAYRENYSAGDIKRTAAAYEEDAVLMPTNLPVLVGRPAIQQFYQANVEQYSFELQLVADEVVFLAPDWAYDRGTYTVTVTPKAGGDPDTDEGAYLVLWHRQADGSWKIARDIDNSTRPKN